MIYGSLRGSRSIGAKIDDRVAQRVANLLTSSNVQDFERGVRIISRYSTLSRAIRGARARRDLKRRRSFARRPPPTTRKRHSH
jgi:hypothetical protein